jgi:hypothetical protein
LTQITIFSGLTDTAGERKATTWERIAGTLTDHKPGERDGSLFSGCTFNGRRARANVEARGLYCLDIEASKTTGEIPPTPEETAALIAARGWRGVIYTTWNHTAEMPRYRVVLPPERQIERAGDVDAVVADGAVTLGLAKMIGLEGVIDRTKICAESMFYLPRHGAERDYFATEIPGEPIDGATLAEARRIGEQLLKDDDVIAEAASTPEQRGNSVIAAYNASVTVAALLEQVDVAVAGDAEGCPRFDGEATEELGQTRRDDILEQHEWKRPRLAARDRHDPRQHLRHLHHGEQPVRPEALRVFEHHAEVEAAVVIAG